MRLQGVVCRTQDGFVPSDFGQADRAFAHDHDELGQLPEIDIPAQVTPLLGQPEIALDFPDPVQRDGQQLTAKNRIDRLYFLRQVVERVARDRHFGRHGIGGLLQTLQNSPHRNAGSRERHEPLVGNAVPQDFIDPRVTQVLLGREMMTVYRDDDCGNLTLTHFCALQNESHMKLDSSTGNSLEFKHAGGMRHDPGKDAHMHDLSISFPGKDKQEHKWVGFAGGKIAEVNVITFSRAES